MNNVERLEEEAERISHPASDIADEIRKMREEQKARESRSSTMYSRRTASGDDSQSPLGRQFSYEYGSHASNSVIGTNQLARSGGYSPAAFVGSPRGSMRSGSWEQVSSTRSRHSSQAQPVRLAQLINEQLQEGGFVGAEFTSSPIEQYRPQTPLVSPIPPPSDSGLRIAIGDSSNVSDSRDMPMAEDLVASAAQAAEPERPSTQASTDTFEKSKDLFENFDGVHTQDQLTGLLPPESVEERHDAQVLPEFMDRRVSSMEAAPLEEMVYYPAPVPAMINLPQRLSKVPSAPQRDKRRTKFLNTLEDNTRRSAVWPQNPLSPVLSEEEHGMPELDHGAMEKSRMEDLPPQLRATMYFDYPAAQQEVQLKDGSAVKTLDSILDASANLPVTAFTDHPFIGKAGANVYKRPPGQALGSQPTEGRRRSSSLNLLKRSSTSNLVDGTETRKSSLLSFARIGRQSRAGFDDAAAQNYTESEAASLHHEGAPLQGEDGEEYSKEGQYHDMADGSQHEHDDQAELDEATQPATLLGELELRKRQQKQRNRTAGGAPNGMHATLLQQDAVAQLQQSSRGKQKTTLAWEDSHAHQQENDDNEDVPLALLYPRRVESHQPLGLIARRELEDNEPLSHRRARLKGQDPLAAQRQRPIQPRLAQPTAVVDTEGDEETLGQRRERLRREKAAIFQPVSGDFTSEILSQFGGLEPKEPPAPSKTPEGLEEETLGQRRKRLQAEQQRGREVSGNRDPIGDPTEAEMPAVTKRRSMADILHAHPVTPRIISNGSGQSHVFAPVGPTHRQTSWSQQVNRSSLTMAAGLGAMAKGGNTKQHDMVDRWRQSVHS